MYKEITNQIFQNQIVGNEVKQGGIKGEIVFEIEKKCHNKHYVDQFRQIKKEKCIELFEEKVLLVRFGYLFFQPSQNFYLIIYCKLFTLKINSCFEILFGPTVFKDSEYSISFNFSTMSLYEN